MDLKVAVLPFAASLSGIFQKGQGGQRFPYMSAQQNCPSQGGVDIGVDKEAE